MLIFAWLFQARPLYIVVFLAGVWAISKLALTASMKQQLDPMEILRDMRQGGIAMNTPIPHLILLCLSNLLTGAQSWRMYISGLTINLWWCNFHLPENYCRALSPILTIILGWECSWYDLAILTYGEAMKPTFGKKGNNKITDGDIKMPADDYCLYHCFNYAMSNGAAPLTQIYAMRLRRKIRTRISAEARRKLVAGLSREADALSKQAARLNEPGSAGYPDEEDFAHFAAEAGFSFAIVQDTIPEPLVYGSELGPVCLTVRRHYVKDGEGHESPHYDVISHVAPTIKTYEELGSKLLDGYKDFLCRALFADPTIGNTALIGMLEAEHGVSAKVSTIKYWRGRQSIKEHIASMARVQLSDALDTYDAMIDSMGPAVITIDEPIDLSGAITIDDGTPAPIELDTIADDAIATGEVPIGRPIGVDGSPAEGAIAVVGSIVASVVTSIGGAIGAITDTVHGATAGGEPIADDGVTINRKRPFYGPDINPDIAFKSGSIDSTMEKKSPSPKRKGGKAEKNEGGINAYASRAVAYSQARRL